MNKDDFLQKSHDADLQWVTLVANSIQLNNKDLERSECIRLAEKALSLKKWYKLAVTERKQEIGDE